MRWHLRFRVATERTTYLEAYATIGSTVASGQSWLLGERLDDRYAINAAKSEMREGYRTENVARILAVYLPGLSDLSDGFPSFGRNESVIVLEERLRQLFARYRVELVPVSMFIDIFGDHAADCGWHELELHSKHNGGSTSIRTRYLEFWKKDADGRWGIQLFLDNRDQAPMLVEDMLNKLRSDDYEAPKASLHCS